MKGKRILSAVLSAALLLQLSPLVAFAEDTTPLPDTISTVQSEPAPELLAEPTPEPTVEPATALPPEPEAEPTATPTPNPTAEPTATPAAETPAPDATAEPTPEPTVEPTATPDAAEQVQALIDALPDADAVTADTADEVEEQLTAIDDAKATLTDEQLGGLDFARYDAAANALLALWGEAPTDEVETLANYPEPGKDGDWYVIDSADDLYWLATTAQKNVKAKLTKDITVNRSVLKDDGNPNSGNFTDWTPITDFTGTLDGQGHTISGLYCNTPDSEYVGLFGSIKGGGTVTHLGVMDSYFAGSGFVGGVCGRNDGTISGCYSTATVSSTLYTGGVLFGYTFGIVKNSFAYGTALNSARSLGSDQGTTTNCFYRSNSAVVEYYGYGVTKATADEFKSGEVAYLLSLNDPLWKQTVNSDLYPNFTGKIVGYANGQYHNHDNAADCPTCNANQNKPAQTTGGIYRITKEAELKWFANAVNTGSSRISAILAADITVTDWTPIGTSTNQFFGTLDGNGFTVTIQNIANGVTDNVGLVGYLGQIGKITNIKVAGTVTGKSNVGGVVGYCDGKLENVINAATVTGKGNVGGVIGYYSANTLYASYNLGNTGNVSGDDITVGGVIGYNQSSLNLYNSYSTTQKLCGRSDGDAYENCFDTVGWETVIQYRGEAAFASGEVAYLLHQGSKGDTWGQNLTAKETAPNCLNNSPQVFRGTSGEYHNHTGESCDKCSATPPQDTNGVYQISTAQQLFGFAQIVAKQNRISYAKAVLTDDIVVTDPWTPIYNWPHAFQGALDGRGHSITFLGNVGSVNTKYEGLCTGLFAETGNEAVIQNLTVSGTFTAASGNVGAIVGVNSGTIKNCRVINSTFRSNGGALVGRNNGTIQNCYSLVRNCQLAGYAGRGISNCYRLGDSASNTDSTVATEQQFQSGEIAYKLAEGNTDEDTFKWGQQIGTGTYPVLGGEKVYCTDGYYHNHTSGSCALCDSNRPTKNDKGAYEIKNYTHLLWFANLVNGTLLPGGLSAKPNVDAVLDDNIAVDSNWPGIGTDSAYGGTFNGNGKTVTLTNVTTKQLFVTTSTDAKLNAICVQGGYLSYTDSATVTNCYRQQDAPLFHNKAAGSAANCYTLGKLAEQASSATFTNCYAGIATGSRTPGIEVKEKDTFESGEVAYKLAEGDPKWGQTLGSNTPTYPVYGGKAVYYNNTDHYHNHGAETCQSCHSIPTSYKDENGNVWYTIRTKDELEWFANWVNGTYTYENGKAEKHPNANAKLLNDIILNTGVLGTDGNLNNGTFKQWTPIGDNNNTYNHAYFTGTFDGDGNTIYGLYVDNSNKNYVGLFGYVQSGGIIQNVNIADSYVSGSRYVGLLCGTNGEDLITEGGTISNCNVSGTVKGAGISIGGLCGNNAGTITDCSNTGKVTGNDRYVGGVCGYNCGTVQRSSNAGSVTGTSGYVGGICGSNTYYGRGNSKKPAQISSCTNTGNVTDSNECVGGVCGYNDANCTIQNSHSTGATVTGKAEVGGICGYSGSNSNITRSYSTGNLTGSRNAGGICGSVGSGASVSNCYYLEATCEDAFGDYSYHSNCESKTAAAFKSGEVAYLLQTAAGETPTWGQTIGTNESPVLAWQKDYKKVYPTAEGSPCKGYSNTKDENRNHKYENGKCIYCGEEPPQVAYTVTIPATVELGNPTPATIKAEGVTLPTNKQLNVKVAEDSVFTVSLSDGTKAVDTQAYTVTKEDGTTKVTPGDTVLTAGNGDTEKSTMLTFNAPDSTKYSGEYTGTVTFTVSVDDKQAS